MADWLGYQMAPGVQHLLAFCRCFWGLDESEEGPYFDTEPERHLSGAHWKLFD